jgi:zinc transport system substrate-binding protein
MKDLKFVVFHDAYQYYEQSFGLHSIGAIALGDANKPSPARIAEIQAAVASAGVECVFAEPQFNPGMVATVLDGSEAESREIDPMGTTLEQGPQFYVSLLTKIGARISSCRATDG